MKNGFDRLAKAYRWMEYVTFGRALERCRFSQLAQLATARHALLLGDGDGRFAERLLRAAPNVHLTAVDASSEMLRALRQRCAQSERVNTLCLDLAQGFPMPLDGERFDLVASHFFLDCLTTSQVEVLVPRIKGLVTPDVRWINSEFQIPDGPARIPAFIAVRLLYAAFRFLTGLQADHLPDYGRALEQNGFSCTARTRLLSGLLVSEVWTLNSCSVASDLQ